MCSSMTNRSQLQCPHCRDVLEWATRSDTALRRCRGCGFVYPVQRVTAEDSIDRDHQVIPCDRYRLIKPLHAWGTGRVYLARHLILDEPCVIKLLSPVDPGYSEEACRRLTAEAKAGFRIHHPNVARVLDCDRNGDDWYFVMEFVDGSNLRDVAQSCGRLPWAQVVEIAQQVAKGLSEIHQAGLFHRDMKPANLILCPDGGVKIMDLGLAQFANPRHAKLTEPGRTGFGIGTPQYMSPEQRGGDAPVTERTDLYGLGATLYHLLVGYPPCRGDGPLDYLTGGDCHAPIHWPQDMIPPIPTWLREVVDTCLSIDPEQRYPNTQELLRAMEKWAGAPSSQAPSAFPAGVGKPHGIVVLPFEHVGGHTEIDWVGQALAEDVHNTLLTCPSLQVIDRHEYVALLGRVHAADRSTLTNAQLIDAAQRLGAAIVIRGTFQQTDTRWSVAASKLDVDHPAGQVLCKVKGAFADVLDLQGEVAKQVVEALGADPARSGESRRRSAGRLSKSARKSYVSAHASFAAGHYAKSVEHCLVGLRKAPDSVELLSLMGVCHARQAAYDLAIHCHRKLEEIARDRDDAHMLVEATGNLGVMFYYKGEYARAFELMRQAGQLAGELNLLPLLAKTSNNIGFVLTRMERYTEADQAFEEAIRIKLSLGATAALVSPYNGRGEIALNLGRFREAMEFYSRALEWSRKLGDQVNIGIGRTNLGRCLLHLGALDEAQDHLHEAIRTLSSTEFWNGMTLAYEQLANLHIKRQQSQAALECIERRIELARKHDNRYAESAAWEQKSRAYELNQQKDEAIECMRRSFHLQRSKSPYDTVENRDTSTYSNSRLRS